MPAAKALPYKDLGERAMDLFSLLLVYVGLIGILLLGSIALVWFLMRLFTWAGLYNPTGPINRNMGRLMILAFVLYTVCGTITLIFYWFYLTPRPVEQELRFLGGG
jgi:hypothetical protein